jgi:hypothetical protein
MTIAIYLNNAMLAALGNAYEEGRLLLIGTSDFDRAIVIAAQSSAPSIMRRIHTSIDAMAPIGSSPTLRTFTSLTDLTYSLYIN